TIRCLRGGDGEKKWRLVTRVLARSLAAGADAGLAGCDDGTLVAFGLEDGRGRWEQTLARKEPLLVSIGGGKIFASSPDKSIYCLRQNRGR
nr:hypothetical protein [bacterium]